MRRTFIIIAIVVALLGIGAVVYVFFFAGSPGVTVAPAGSVNLPSAGQGTIPSSGGTGAGTSGASGASSSTVEPVVVTSRLVKISVGPVVPGEVVVTKAGSASSSPETTVRYIERASGNVYSYSPTARTNTRTSNKTIPGIQSAAWLPDGSTAFVRYLSGAEFTTINTYALTASSTGGFFLSQNLADISVSATSLLTVASGVNGSTASLTRTDGTKATTIFSTPLSAIRASFAGKQYLAVTKASASLPGDAFIVDSSGRFSRVAGPLNGLVALASPSGKWALVSYTDGSRLQMELVNTATSETIQLPVATVADKCVWAADDSAIYCGIPMEPPTSYAYPDDWYQGVVQFSDRIWKIQVTGRYAQLVLDFPTETEQALDATALAIDSANTTLVFINKIDGSLWSYSL